MLMRSGAPSLLSGSQTASVRTRASFSGLIWEHGSEFTPWHTLTGSIRKANSWGTDSAKGAICASIQQVRILALMKRKKIVESNRNRSELRAHGARESDVESGCLRGLWENRV